MRASETVLRTLLQGEKRYVVPLYQRTYSWKRAQLERLWSDILDLVHQSQIDNHFLGSIVLAPSQSITASGVQSWLIVDGQQRLTTLSILLCAIRDYSSETNPQLARRIDVHYLTNEFAKGDDYYTLVPTQADRESWRALVDRHPNAGGEDGIGDAYRYFRGRIQRAAADGDDAVQEIEKVVASRLSFVEISAHHGDNVYKIFESLNNTGLKLTQADLLRNYLFMRLPTTSERVYRQYWLPLQSLMTDESLVDLIWLDLVLKGNRSATQRNIYEEQHRLLEELRTEERIESWVIELHRKARVFRRVLVPEEEPEPLIKEALDRLSRWRAKVVHPIALYVLIAYDEGRMKPQEVADALRAAESYLVRQLMVGTPRTGSNILLLDLIRSLDGDIPYQSRILQILTGQRRRFPSDDQIRDAMLEQPFYWRGKEWQKKFILRSLEESFGRTEMIDFEKSSLTIEHVMPQKLTKEWREVLNEDLDDYESVDEAHDSLIHTIGNLTLSAYNGTLSNKVFAEKKAILAGSGLAMNLAIAASDGWGVHEIRRRSQELAEKAIQIWPGPDESYRTGPGERRISLVKQVLAEIPAGRWTNFLSLAQAAGVHQRAISTMVCDGNLINSHRVLRRDGAIAPSSRDPQQQIELLKSEGVRFDDRGRASSSQYIGYLDLTALIEPRDDDD